MLYLLPRLCFLHCLCCGADTRVDSANEFKGFIRVRMVTARDMEGETEGGLTDTTKVTILFAGITNVYVNVRGGCNVVFSKDGLRR